MSREKLSAGRLWPALMALALMLAPLALTSCPGGGGDGGVTVIPVTSVSIDGEAAFQLVEDQHRNLTATVNPENATNRTVTWASSNPAVATVNTTTGRVDAVSAAVEGGTTQITATAGGVTSAAVTVTVIPAAQYIQVVGISIDQGADETIPEGEYRDLTVTFNPANATTQTVTWSGDNAYVTVSAAGRVTAVAEGYADITATSTANPEASATIRINVVDPGTYVSVESVTIAPAGPHTLTLVTAPTLDLSATVLPADATSDTVTWASSNPAAATVNATSGTVTAVAVGYTYITATAGGISSTPVRVNVVDPAYVAVESVTIAPAGPHTLTLAAVGPAPTLSLSATVLPANATSDTVTWASSNPAAATVNASGTVTAVAEGYTDITATAGGETSAPVRVNVEAAVVVESAEVPFTWNFNDPAGPVGWPADIPSGTGTGAAYQNTTLDVAYTNNMTLLAGSIDSGIIYGPSATQGTALEGVPMGRIQLTGNPGVNNPFLSIAQVQGPFTLSIVISGTGGTQGSRPVRAYVDGAEIGQVDIYTEAGEGQNWRRGTFTYTGTGLVEIDLRTNNGIRLYQVALVEVQDEQLPPYERLPGTPGNLDDVRIANADDIAWDMRDLNATELMAHFAGLNNRMVNSVHTVGGQTIVVSTDAGEGPGGDGGTHDSQGHGWAALTILRPNMTLGMNYVLHITGRVGIDGEVLAVNPGQMGLSPDRTATMTLTDWGQPLPIPFTITHELTSAQAAGTPNVEIRWNLTGAGLNPLPPTFAISIDDMVIVSVEAAAYEVARAELQAEINIANLRVLGGYTTATWTPFAAALAAANTAMTSTNVDDIDSARANLVAVRAALAIDADPAWATVLDSPYVAAVTGGAAAWNNVVSVAEGLLVHNRGANNQGLGIDVTALRAMYPGSAPAIVVTGRMSTQHNMMLQGVAGNIQGAVTAPQGTFTVTIPYASSVAIPGWASAWAPMPWITNADGVFGDFLVTEIQVGSMMIQQLLVPPDPELGITIRWLEFVNAAAGAAIPGFPASVTMFGAYSVTLQTTGVPGFAGVRWLTGGRQVGTESTLVINSAVHQNGLGTHTLTAIVEVNRGTAENPESVFYSRTFTFTVRP